VTLSKFNHAVKYAVGTRKNDLHVRSDRFALTALRSWTARILFH
jgi:hypothetical protein